MKTRFLLPLLLLAVSPAHAQSAKSYQVTGPIIALTDNVITVQKGDEKWEVSRSAATKVDGKLAVGTRVTIHYKMSADSVEVKDTGIGIEAQKLPHIFERFYQADALTTRRYGGSGLGLSISKKLIELFHGELRVESELYKGSHFHFNLTLPVYVEKKTLIEEQSAQMPLLTGARVMIAEDNPVNMMIARKFLQKWNLEISEAHNGAQAIEIFREKPFDILLVDLEMPEKDGYSVLEEVRKINPTIPVSAFTAASFENMAFVLKEKGFTDYVQKPFKPEELHSKLMRFVRLPAA